MAQRPDHRRGHRHLGERLQRLHLREAQGETTSVDTPATSEARRGRRENSELLQNTSHITCILHLASSYMLYVMAMLCMHRVRVQTSDIRHPGMHRLRPGNDGRFNVPFN